MSLFDQQKAAPPEIRVVVNFLRSKAGPKLRTGVLSGKRIDYFKGELYHLYTPPFLLTSPFQAPEPSKPSYHQHMRRSSLHRRSHLKLKLRPSSLRQCATPSSSA